ncbi:hypothetical protein D4764_14G0000640 [Takifugu flavidus]|uniref:Uncharacterized protein n=1 Tax=Takifugu flavidus TaxID=433684 RepID=A0A5C6P3C1_9TELE|nr:hypothetical protein D4764_14G0000640 [Takifugu flavidus]
MRLEFLPPGQPTLQPALPVSTVYCLKSSMGHHGLIELCLMASLTSGVHHRIQALPPPLAPETLCPQLKAAMSPMEVENKVHSA